MILDEKKHKIILQFGNFFLFELAIVYAASITMYLGENAI